MLSLCPAEAAALATASAWSTEAAASRGVPVLLLPAAGQQPGVSAAPAGGLRGHVSIIILPRIPGRSRHWPPSATNSMEMGGGTTSPVRHG
eukprot:COSAG06_NODE_32796_length_500_cov_0.907731_1_plen_90_part_01